MQYPAQYIVAGIGVLGASPGLPTDGEVCGGYLLGGLQPTVLAGGLSVLADERVLSVGVVHHAVVNTSIEFQSVVGFENFVYIGHDALDRLPAPEVADMGALPSGRPVVSRADDGSELLEGFYGRLDDEEPALHGCVLAPALHVVVPCEEQLLVYTEQLVQVLQHDRVHVQVHHSVVLSQRVGPQFQKLVHPAATAIAHLLCVLLVLDLIDGDGQWSLQHSPAEALQDCDGAVHCGGCEGHQFNVVVGGEALYSTVVLLGSIAENQRPVNKGPVLRDGYCVGDFRPLAPLLRSHLSKLHTTWTTNRFCSSEVKRVLDEHDEHE
mmetsp:Transcript_1923/g.3944  ORF Transcript_1923/g.3944 Transcript_1923/m.3944 type:complete len:323 (+) Transcript_1923:2107-3075(+)